jgi:phosphatidate phosphatase APP1
MNRPYLVNFSAIDCDTHISIRANITNSYTPLIDKKNKIESTSPIQSIRLFSKDNFRIKILGFTDKNDNVFSKEFDSDSYGRFEIQIPHDSSKSKITRLLTYETSQLRGIDIHLGNFLPLHIKNPKKLLISDFDKTLVDTKYHTAKEMYYSLNKPLNYFPTVKNSVDKIKYYIDESYQPFILSASPHFYENAIRDWLYQNNIFTSHVYLKDYRDFISVFDGAMTSKDLKQQGFYKLGQLVDILLMTGIPDHIVLMGDGFESDPYIYLTLRSLIKDKADPWKLWSSIKNHSIFNLTTKQNSYFLTKFYRLSELSKQKGTIEFKIYIRSTKENHSKLKEMEFKNPYLNGKNSEIDYYIG